MYSKWLGGCRDVHFTSVQLSSLRCTEQHSAALIARRGALRCGALRTTRTRSGARTFAGRACFQLVNCKRRGEQRANSAAARDTRPLHSSPLRSSALLLCSALLLLLVLSYRIIRHTSISIMCRTLANSSRASRLVERLAASLRSALLRSPPLLYSTLLSPSPRGEERSGKLLDDATRRDATRRDELHCTALH